MAESKAFDSGTSLGDTHQYPLMKHLDGVGAVFQVVRRLQRLACTVYKATPVVDVSTSSEYEYKSLVHGEYVPHSSWSSRNCFACRTLSSPATQAFTAAVCPKSKCCSGMAGFGVARDIWEGKILLQKCVWVVALTGQLAGLAQRHKGHTQPQRQRRAEKEAPRLKACTVVRKCNISQSPDA